MGGILGLACAFCTEFIWSAHQDGDWTPSPNCLLHFRLILLTLVRMCNFCSFVLGIYKLHLPEKRSLVSGNPRSSLFATENKSPNVLIAAGPGLNVQQIAAGH